MPSETELLDAGYLERKQLDLHMSFTRTVRDFTEPYEPACLAGAWVAVATAGWHGVQLEWQPEAAWGMPRLMWSCRMLRFGKLLLDWH